MLPERHYRYFLSEAHFGSEDEDGRQLVRLSGGNPGLQAGLLIYPALGVSGAVLSNCWAIDSRNGEMIELAGRIALIEAGRSAAEIGSE